MKKILLLNGPNLNLLGRREPDVYGSTTLEQIVRSVQHEASKAAAEIVHFQSNCEGEIVSHLQSAMEGYTGVIINPGAYTHYSYAIRDAIQMLPVPTIEVHISNIHKREEFRSKSVISAVCKGSIIGLGSMGYVLALHALLQL